MKPLLEMIKNDLSDMIYFAQKVYIEHWPLKLVSGAIFALIAYIVPETAHSAVNASVGLIALDFVTGIIASWAAGEAIYNRNLFKSFIKFVGYFSVMAVAAVCTKELPMFSGSTTTITTLVLWGIIITESHSILSNVRKMGVTLPKFVEDIFKEQLKGRGWLTGKVEKDVNKDDKSYYLR